MWAVVILLTDQRKPLMDQSDFTKPVRGWWKLIGRPAVPLVSQEAVEVMQDPDVSVSLTEAASRMLRGEDPRLKPSTSFEDYKKKINSQGVGC